MAAKQCRFPPVDDETVNKTLPYMKPILAAMVRFQRLTGCRPGEVVAMRPEDIDRSGDVWTYTPASHKTEHHGKSRVIYIGPQAQQILAPWLLKARQYVFPSRGGRSYSTDTYRRAIHRACDRAFPAPAPLARREDETPTAWKQRLTAEQQKQLRKWQSDHRWSPQQLRKSAATRIRAALDVEHAASVRVLLRRNDRSDIKVKEVVRGNLSRLPRRWTKKREYLQRRCDHWLSSSD